jgi:uncharacterized protein
MRFLLFLLFLLAVDLYAFQAFRILAQNWSFGARTALYSFFWFFTAFSLFYFLSHNLGWAGGWSRNMETYSRTLVFISFLSKLLIVPMLLIDDLRRGFVWAYNTLQHETVFNPARSRFLSNMGLFIGAIPFFSLSYGAMANPYRYRLRKQKVVLNKLPAALKGLKIVQISDIHSGSFTFKEPVRNAIDIINAQNADIVLFTGDLVNNVSTEMDRFMDVFDKIKSKYGIFSVLGNHDYGDYHDWKSPEEKVANLDRLKGIHKKLGWDLLINEHRILQINEEPVAVLGVENFSSHLRFPKYGKLDQAYQGSQDAKLKLLLSHDPSHWDYQVTPEYPDVDITFSGHTHGFQFGVEIPGWFKWSPVQYVYKQWAGLYQKGEQYLYVNRGLGFLGYPGRVGILPEITLIELG